MRWAPIREGDVFHLWWAETNESLDFLTRGRTEEEARHGIERDGRLTVKSIRRTDSERDARLYTSNHAPGWEARPMYWLLVELGLDPREHGHGGRGLAS